MKRAQPERQLQAAVAQYLKAALPADAFFSALPGGDGRMTRAPGYRAGLPDLMVFWNTGAADPRLVFFELKSKVGRLSREQLECHNAMRIADAFVYTVKSIAEVESWLRYCGIPLRAAVAA